MVGNGGKSDYPSLCNNLYNSRTIAYNTTHSIAYISTSMSNDNAATEPYRAYNLLHNVRIDILNKTQSY